MGQFALEYAPGRAATPAQQIVRWLYNKGLSDETIATVINCHGTTINKIRHARESGRNLEPRLRALFALMRECYA
jgi:hypothetical protein